MSPRRRTSRSLEPATGEPTRRAEIIRDVDHAVQELAIARDELRAIPTDLSRIDRDRALIEPLSRLSLVKRFCGGVLARYGWEPAR